MKTVVSSLKKLKPSHINLEVVDNRFTIQTLTSRISFPTSQSTPVSTIISLDDLKDFSDILPPKSSFTLSETSLNSSMANLNFTPLKKSQAEPPRLGEKLYEVSILASELLPFKPYVGHDAVRSYLNGINLEPDTGSLTATNGHVLLTTTSDLSQEKPESYIIPKEILDHINLKTGFVTVSFYSYHVVFKFSKENTDFELTLPFDIKHETFPDYRRIIRPLFVPENSIPALPAPSKSKSGKLTVQHIDSTSNINEVYFQLIPKGEYFIQDFKLGSRTPKYHMVAMLMRK